MRGVFPFLTVLLQMAICAWSWLAAGLAGGVATIFGTMAPAGGLQVVLEGIRVWLVKPLVGHAILCIRSQGECPSKTRLPAIMGGFIPFLAVLLQMAVCVASFRS